jgi:hypothetical protein
MALRAAYVLAPPSSPTWTPTVKQQPNSAGWLILVEKEALKIPKYLTCTWGSTWQKQISNATIPVFHQGLWHSLYHLWLRCSSRYLNTVH